VSEKFSIEIISPDRSILKMETSEVVIPSFEGEMGILKDHISLITFLRPGIINIKAGTEQKFFVEEGTVEFSNNNLLILTSTAVEVTKMNKKFIDTLISVSEKKLDNNEISDKERYLLSYKLETLRNISQ
tara:strand:+ start:101 stop:490 length:390 start_codon:yes stop_codon:yes gene_type:complete